MSLKPRLLLLSNSSMSGTKYMEWSKEVITNFLTTKVKQITFIPFAAVSFDWDIYEEKVKSALTQFNIKSIHKSDNYLETIAKSEAIVVGGGNTFHLLFKLQEYNLIEAIRKRVLEDGIPYVGWSAGANIATPDIGTTNDMPIIWPKTDAALNLVPYNINPHYNDWKPEGHNGEGRPERLDECVLIKKRPIVAISEGIGIEVLGDKHTIIAPNLNLTPDKRVVKIWFHNSNKDNKIEVIDAKFNEDVLALVSNKR